MRQVLFWIPTRFFDGLPSWWPDLQIPIYGYGMMLFAAFLACTWLAGRRARKQGIARERIQDLAMWIFLGGIIGARITYMIQYHRPIEEFFQIWQGGLVFYGSAIGGVAGYTAAYVFVIRKYQLSSLKLADIIAPCVPVGLCLGRIGCLLNGCCYGNVACPAHWWDIPFPLSSPARFALVERGLQTPAGFTMKNQIAPAIVDRVERDSPAYAEGLRDGDEILKADRQDIAVYRDAAGTRPDALETYLVQHWRRGKVDLALTVRHRDGKEEALAPIHPETLHLHPTQVFESISMVLLLFVLLAFEPFRRHDGELMALLMILYPIHRFLDEMLRNDTDPVAFHMTLSQNISILVIVAGIAWFCWLRRQPAQ